MKIDIYSRFDENIKQIWLRFEKDNDILPFQKFDWLNQWYKFVGLPLFSIYPQIVHIELDGETALILPFGLRTKYGIKILEWLGGINTDYMGPLINNKSIKLLENNNIWSKIRQKIKKHDLIHLEKQTLLTIDILKKIGFKSRGNENLKSFQTELLPSWDDYAMKISKKVKSDSRRQRRRLGEIGNLKFNFAEDNENKERIIELMINQKKRRYNETKVWDMFSINEYNNFYKSLSTLDPLNSFIHCSELRVDNNTIATHVGITNSSTFYYLMPAHEAGEWEKYSPGRLLLIELLKWAIKNNKKIFDFTVGGEKYKKVWCDLNLDLFEILYPVTFKGRIMIKIISLKLFLKKIIKSNKSIEKLIRFILGY
jgi:CelD/BcsL family acetyltransferase involved in cellulose biosynthesis